MQLTMRCVLLLIWVLRATAGPLLKVMYLKYEDQPIDLTPVFDPMVSEYQATLDWKMRFFSVQATPEPPGIINNVHLCPQDADCLKQDQKLVTMDFSKRILVRPGEKGLFMFDVLLQGVVMTYTIIVTRLQGTETSLRRLIVQGTTLYPAFRPATFKYDCLVSVKDELANMELHVMDSGQQVFATAEDPVPITVSSNLSTLVNSNPGQTMAPPERLLMDSNGFPSGVEYETIVEYTTSAPEYLRWHKVPMEPRRLTEEEFGEFQYPKRFVSFPTPLSSSRLIQFKITSADGGHFGYYSVEVTRLGCSKNEPLYDVNLAECVKFCDKGFYGDFKAGRCKRCKDTCVNCVTYYQCVECKEDDRRFTYSLNNSTGTCSATERPFWDQHPQETMAAGLGSGAFCIFLVGLYGFRRDARRTGRPNAQERYLAKRTRGLDLSAGKEDVPLRRGIRDEEDLDEYDVY